MELSLQTDLLPSGGRPASEAERLLNRCTFLFLGEPEGAYPGLQAMSGTLSAAQASFVQMACVTQAARVKDALNNSVSLGAVSQPVIARFDVDVEDDGEGHRTINLLVSLEDGTSASTSLPITL